MKPPSYREQAAEHVSASQLTCALCGGDLIRVHRRPIDRLWSLFVPMQRYRCNRFSCGWTGNLRVNNSAATLSTEKRKNQIG